MHAAERFDGVVDKLRECEKELDAAKEAAAEVTARFEEVKSERQRLFQDCYQHVSEALAVIYKDLTRSSKHPLGNARRKLSKFQPQNSEKWSIHVIQLTLTISCNLIKRRQCLFNTG